MAFGIHNMDEAWDDDYSSLEGKSQKISGQNTENWDDPESFAELFEKRGMQGFKPKEKIDDSLKHPKIYLPGLRYPEDPEDTLDLHGITTDEVEYEVERFILECRERGNMFVLVITGQGKNSEGGKSKLRPIVIAKLNGMLKNQAIVSYKTAESKHGGFGAIYVYLR